jgi:hypothetical protein
LAIIPLQNNRRHCIILSYASLVMLPKQNDSYDGKRQALAIITLIYNIPGIICNNRHPNKSCFFIFQTFITHIKQYQSHSIWTPEICFLQSFVFFIKSYSKYCVWSENLISSKTQYTLQIWNNIHKITSFFQVLFCCIYSSAFLHRKI